MGNYFSKQQEMEIIVVNIETGYGELNHSFMIIDGYSQDSEDEENDYHNDKGSNKKSSELYLNNLSIVGYDREIQIFKTKNIIYDGSDVCDFQKHINYSALFDPDNSGQQVESSKVENELEDEDFIEPLHLIKVSQFENLHSTTIPINSFQILSNLSRER
ncbi:hypothetical protein ACTFIZ_008189 [Dictyostelium cf. discoideum]